MKAHVDVKYGPINQVGKDDMNDKQIDWKQFFITFSAINIVAIPIFGILLWSQSYIAHDPAIQELSVIGSLSTYMIAIEALIIIGSLAKSIRS